MKKLLLFQVGIMQFGIDLHLVSSIQPMQKIVVEQPEKGHRRTQVMDDRETELCDLFSFFEKGAPSSTSDSQKIIMVEVGGVPLGMIVDRVDRVVSVESNRIEPLAPVFKDPAMICFPGVLKYDDGLFLILNPKGIASVKRQRSDFSGSNVKAPDREQHPGASRHRAEGNERQPQMPFSDNRFSRSTAQSSALDLDNKVQQCMKITI